MELSEIRRKIDSADEKILPLFIERMDLALKAAQYKAENRLETLDRGREREILKRVYEESGDMEQYAHRLYTTLFELSRAYQESNCNKGSAVRALIEKALENRKEIFPQSGSVACQGIDGAYSQLAAQRMIPRGNIMFFKSFEAVFDAVEGGLCSYGVLPIENSSNGSVRSVYDLLQKRDVCIVKSNRLCIRHELLSRPGAKLSELREIYSHEQAIGQCSEFLKSLGEKVKIIPCENTAVAAKIVSQVAEGCAAISSPECARLYGLEPITEKIQNSDNNYTRFICIEKKPAFYSGADRITLILTCDHRPGSLYEVLAKFAALEVNLIKLESCPIAGHDFEFSFFFEIEASILDEKIVSMLESLQQSCKQFKYLGNYAEA